MSSELKINKNLSDEEIYLSLKPQIESLIYSGDSISSGLSNFVAALKEAFPKISWIGFYFADNDLLHLGPFQGKVACTQIKLGKGVCGTSASSRATVIVDDVDKFPGHIACDSGSKSEIVIPIIVKDQLIGVLDIDSYQYSSFNNTDKKHLEELVELLKSKLDFLKFIRNFV